MTRLWLAVVAVFAAMLTVPGVAGAARFAVGIERHADAGRIAVAVADRGGRVTEDLGPIRALVVSAPAGARLGRIRGVRYVERLESRRLALTPTDPFVSRQWYLVQSHFYESWLTFPAFESVPVAVIDSGVDATHPELAGRILDAKSFVGGSARVDALGHGTFVAGLIAAGVDNGVGIAGLAPSAQLLVAKVVTSSRSIPIVAEARAVRWAVDSGARVINMSLGGLRDPLDRDRDSFSQLEADAVAYAVENGVLVVAAVGNDDQAPSSPWPYASYPAALPHVLGVSALAENGSVPQFSNRDRIYNDISAPGEQILSIFPRPLTSRFPACAEQGFSSCGPDEYREAQGTSFAAPQVTAAAAVLLSLRPSLRPEQTSAILRHSAADVNAENGCLACAPGRDSLSGWGRLDMAAALDELSKPLPLRDRHEANDDVGPRSAGVAGSDRRVTATVDFWDDQDDVYAIGLRKGQAVYVGLTAADRAVDLNLALWLPQTESIDDVRSLRWRVRLSAKPLGREYLSYRARAAGTYFVQVRMSAPGTTAYRLAIVKS
jgi:subtilisin family serine protease